MKFALYFGNRGFFPGELVDEARSEMIEAVTKAGHTYVCLDKTLTRYGAIEGLSEGMVYSDFLKSNNDEIDGAIMCLPNFSDENGAVAAFKNFKKPILIQAYPDKIGEMDFAHRRDSYCGKFSIMDMFNQNDIEYTAYKPHVISPLDPRFITQIQDFSKVCAVVKKMRDLRVGAIGARTTAFKTVRFDELTLEKWGVTVDTFDLLELYGKVQKMEESEVVAERVKDMKNYSDFSKVPEDKILLLAKISLVMESYVNDYHLDVLALRCWNEFPEVMHVSVCVVVSYLNNIGIPCACELDVLNAISMAALTEASGGVSTCLDWNNNYGEEEDKCILFHCGPVPQDMMSEKGQVTDHKMFAKSYGSGNAFGSNEGRIKAGNFTYLSGKTEDGMLCFYAGEGKFTGEPIEKEFFGCGGVAEIEDLEDIVLHICKSGYRHHVSVTFGNVMEILEEAFESYLHYDVTYFESSQCDCGCDCKD